MDRNIGQGSENCALSAMGAQRPINVILYCFSSVVIEFIRHYFPTASKSGISRLPIGIRHEKRENSAKISAKVTVASYGKRTSLSRVELGQLHLIWAVAFDCSFKVQLLHNHIYSLLSSVAYKQMPTV